MATGTGKTVVFSLIASDLISKGGRVLILAHRDELIRQAADKLHTSTGLCCQIEKADERAGRCMERVIVGSVQTLLSPERRDSIWTPTHIIVDEAHHVLSPSYLSVLGHWPQAKVLGVTATPDRGDLRNLGEFFEETAYEYLLTQAIGEGYLSKIKVQTIPLKINVMDLKANGDDFTKEDVGNALLPYLPQIGAELAEHCRDRKLIVFAPLRDTARKVQAALQDNGLKCFYADGEDRHELKEFEAAGPGCAIANAMLLTEGYDCPNIDAVCVLRLTGVRSLYAQMVGRGTRLSPSKDHLLVLDFLWMSRRHALCRPASLIAEDADVAEAMTEAFERDAGTADMELDESALAQAHEDVIKKREEVLAKRLAEMRHKKRELVDPLQYAMSIGSEQLVNYQPAMKAETQPPTAQQIEALAKHGIFPGDITSAGHAQVLIQTLEARKTSGMALPRQVRCLERYGRKNAGKLESEAATKIIRRIAGNGWRLPDGLRQAWKEQGVFTK
jgi:superfamily II DNA or RNA helicase